MSVERPDAYLLEECPVLLWSKIRESMAQSLEAAGLCGVGWEAYIPDDILYYVLPSLISLMVSVDVKHHVYLRTYLLRSSVTNQNIRDITSQPVNGFRGLNYESGLKR